MKLKRHLHQLAAWAKDEAAAQARLFALLEQQEDAVRRGHTADVRASGEALERELPSGAERERRRTQVIAELARALRLPAATLTLSSIAERAAGAGEDVRLLLDLRDELRANVAAVVRTGRRIAALARYHQDVLADLMQVLSTSGMEEHAPSDGALVDAEA